MAKFKIKITIPKGLFAIWKPVLSLLVKEPKVIIPFCLLAVIEVFALWFLSCSPHFPINVIMAPPIKSIWGPTYLHYPYIYELLPRMFYYAKIVVGVMVGALTSGMAVLAVYYFNKSRRIDLKEIFFAVLKRYVSLFLLAIILFTCVHFVMKEPSVLLLKYFFAKHAKLLFLGPKFWFSIFLPVLQFLLAVILQSLFVYSIPYIVIKEKKFLAALISGIVLFFKRFLKTFAAVLVPMFLYIPVTMLRSNMGLLADMFMPESIVVVLFIGIIVGTVIVDALVTLATTLIFIGATDEA